MSILSLKVGQVFFFLVRGEGKLKPVRVVEEVTRKTLNGIETVYMVQFSDQKENVFPFDSLKGDCFTNPEEAYKSLTERSNAAIKRLVDAASTKARHDFPDAQFFTQANIPIIGSEEKEANSRQITDGETLIEGPDGKMFKVRNVTLPESYDPDDQQ